MEVLAPAVSPISQSRGPDQNESYVVEVMGFDTEVFAPIQQQ